MTTIDPKTYNGGYMWRLADLIWHQPEKIAIRKVTDTRIILDGGSPSVVRDDYAGTKFHRRDATLNRATVESQGWERRYSDTGYNSAWFFVSEDKAREVIAQSARNWEKAQELDRRRKSGVLYNVYACDSVEHVAEELVRFFGADKARHIADVINAYQDAAA
jgi:ribulose bisphosphate carboxylase small subunit